MSKNIIALVANADFPSSKELETSLRSIATVIAVDGGLRHCHRLGIVPNYIVGDFDSASSHLLSSYPKDIQRHIPDQSKTDLQKALTFALQLHPDRIVVFAAIGNRVDHTLTNLYLLSSHPGRIVFETDTESIYALEKKTSFKATLGQTISLLPIYGEVKGVTTRGLKWNLNCETLNKNFVGISNLCVEEEVEIEYRHGNLLMIVNRI